MGGGLTGLYHCKYTNYHRASRLYRVLFSTKLERSAEQLLAADLSYCWLYPSKQAIDRFMLCTLTVFYSPTWNAQLWKIWQQISLPILLALADYWSWRVWLTSQVPLTPGQSQVINWIVHDRVRWAGYKLNKFHGAILIFTLVLTTQLCWRSVV